MIWIMAGVTTILSCELFCRIAIIDSILEIKLQISKAVRVLKSESISDHWKEWIIPKYAFRISRYSILFFLYLIIALCPFFLAGLISIFIDLNFYNSISEPISIVVITMFAWVYIVVRKNWGYLLSREKNEAPSKYNFISKLLHHLALNSDIRLEISFDIEKYKFSKIIKSNDQGHHVFVCGLARSGTTILMRRLHQSGQFSSLTYRDMPFVLAPNVWSKITSKYKNSIQKEMRAHNDGIFVDFDSPEALEEVFWRVFAGKDYIHPNYLTPHEFDDDLIAAFRTYIALINLRYSKDRYLSKNNNNILHLSAITDAFPNAIVLIPFREPLQHAFSLLKQHQNFVIRHQEDKFSRKYMSWLVHHEFGLDHRPFQFEDNGFQHDDINTIDYWLYQWNNVYSFLFDKVRDTRKSIFFVGYEDLCQKDRTMWREVANLAGIPIKAGSDFILKERIAPSPTDVELKEKSSKIYNDLLLLSRKRLPT